MDLLELHQNFEAMCEAFDVPPKYVLFSVISTVLAAVFGLGIKGMGKLSWLTVKGTCYGAYKTVQWFRPKPDQLSQVVLATLDKGTLLSNTHTQIVAEGCVATFITLTQDVNKQIHPSDHTYYLVDGEQTRVGVTVDGIAVTKLLNPTGIKKIFELYKTKKAALAQLAKVTEAENAQKLTQHMTQRLLLLKAKA